MSREQTADLLLERVGGVGPLLALQDVEVVVRGVATAVALGAEGRTEDDEVLGDAGVDDELEEDESRSALEAIESGKMKHHRAHGSSSTERTDPSASRLQFSRGEREAHLLKTHSDGSDMAVLMA